MWMATNNNNANRNKNAPQLFVQKNLELDYMMQQQIENETVVGSSFKEEKEKKKVRKMNRNDKFSSQMYSSKK